MHTLAFYTSGPGCALAIVNQTGCLAQIQKDMARGQDAHLPALTDAVLTQAGLSLQDITRFGVVIGPGSFTGIRIGVAFARGLALACNRPCIGVTSLEASLPDGQQGSAIVLLPAQKRPPELTFWAQTFRSGTATQAPQEYSAAEIVKRLKARPHMVYGDAKALTDIIPQLNLRHAQPSAVRAAQLSLEFDPDTHAPEPVYARAPDASPRVISGA